MLRKSKKNCFFSFFFPFSIFFFKFYFLFTRASLRHCTNSKKLCLFRHIVIFYRLRCDDGIALGWPQPHSTYKHPERQIWMMKKSQLIWVYCVPENIILYLQYCYYLKHHHSKNPVLLFKFTNLEWCVQKREAITFIKKFNISTSVRIWEVVCHP